MATLDRLTAHELGIPAEPASDPFLETGAQALSVYVAGAWVEQNERARPMIARLSELGAIVVHDWTIAHYVPGPPGHDATLSRERRRTHAGRDMAAVCKCDVLWLLASLEGVGSWVEFGAAWARGVHLVVSGPHALRTIFTEYATIFETDAEALEHLAARLGARA